ncbi:hypothetical protein ACLFMI_08545 [Pseudonocardia nantongensis]|uniref:hypothetical protein n=1 Tax=Pseudonocardia nantongensis TaxID=1181885 RepID=UPI00397AA225
MAERDSTSTGRRRSDLIALVAGVLSLLVAGTGIAGVSPADVVDLRWVLAAVAVLAGILLLVAGLRNSRTGSDD